MTDRKISYKLRTHSFFDQMFFVKPADAIKLKVENAVIITAQRADDAKLDDLLNM